MRSKPVQWAILILILAAAIYVVFTQMTDHSAAIKPGHAAPDFTLERLDGGSVTLSDLRGHAVVLNFWGTYCGPCREEMPDFQQEYRQYHDKGLEILGINTGEKSRVSIDSFVKQVDAQFPILLDAGLSVVHLYKVGPLPESVFIDKNGTITAIHVGQMDRAGMEHEIAGILP